VADREPVDSQVTLHDVLVHDTYDEYKFVTTIQSTSITKKKTQICTKYVPSTSLHMIVKNLIPFNSDNFVSILIVLF
jgi:hypothetical protein